MKYVFALVLIAVLLVACTATVKPLLEQDERVQTFLNIYPDASYDSVHITESGVVDLYTQECADIAVPFTRAVYTQYGARLVAYVDNTGAVICVFSKIDTSATPVIQGDQETAPENVALTVNGRPIMMDRLQAVFATLPAEQQTIGAVNTIIDQLIAAELLRQEASEYDVSSEIEDAYVNLIEQSGLDETAFTASLAEQGTSEDAIRLALTEQLKVTQLLNEKLRLDEITVDEEQAKQIYIENTDSFLVSEQATFQQIFISFVDMTSDDATAKANQAAQALSTSDFCTVVKRYSDDTDSIERCGIYTIPRGIVAPQLEQAAFSAEINETVIIQTENGLHIMRIMARQPTQVIAYEQVRDQVVGLVQNQVAQLRINAYLASLRKDAEVVIFLQVIDSTDGDSTGSNLIGGDTDV